jgi:hypothetical protein
MCQGPDLFLWTFVDFCAKDRTCFFMPRTRLILCHGPDLFRDGCQGPDLFVCQGPDLFKSGENKSGPWHPDLLSPVLGTGTDAKDWT